MAARAWAQKNPEAFVRDPLSIEQVLADLSRVLTLEPGDVISMGTPGGIGSARKPPVVLHEGDVVECEIDGIGTLRNPVVLAYG